MTIYNESLDWARRYLDAYAALTRFEITSENREKLISELRNQAAQIQRDIDESLAVAEISSIDTIEIKREYTQLKQKLEKLLSSK